MKRILIAATAAFATLSGASVAFAAQFQFQPIVALPIDGSNIVGSGTSLCTYLSTVFKISISVAVVLAVIMIIIDGFKYMTSEAVGNKKDALGGIRSALAGLILLLASYLILFIINPSITSLSVLSPNGGVLSGLCANNAAPNTSAAATTQTAAGSNASLPGNSNTGAQSCASGSLANSSAPASSASWCYTVGSGSFCYSDQNECECYRKIDYANGAAGTSAACTSQ